MGENILLDSPLVATDTDLKSVQTSNKSWSEKYVSIPQHFWHVTPKEAMSTFNPTFFSLHVFHELWVVMPNIDFFSSSDCFFLKNFRGPEKVKISTISQEKEGRFREKPEKNKHNFV